MSATFHRLISPKDYQISQKKEKRPLFLGRTDLHILSLLAQIQCVVVRSPTQNSTHTTTPKLLMIHYALAAMRVTPNRTPEHCANRLRTCKSIQVEDSLRTRETLPDLLPLKPRHTLLRFGFNTRYTKSRQNVAPILRPD